MRFNVSVRKKLKSTKKHGNLLIWEKKTTLPKKSYFIVFELLTSTYQNVKLNASFMEEMNNITKKLVFTLILILLRRKTVKCMESTRYMDTKRHYEKCVL